MRTVEFAACKCDVYDHRLHQMREQYLDTVNSIIRIFDAWQIGIESGGRVKFITTDSKCTVFLVGDKAGKVELVNTHISFPLICGTQLWIAEAKSATLRQKRNNSEIESPTLTSLQVWQMECGFCTPHCSSVPHTLSINGTVMFQQIFGVIDSQRPHVYRVAKRGDVECESSCYVGGKKIETRPLYKSRNPILTTSGSLASQRLYPITATFVKKLDRLIGWALAGKLTKKQGMLESTKLFSGNIDGIFSTRAAYSSHEDYDESCQSKLVTGFEKNNTRYQQLKNTTIQRLATPLMLFKLIRAKHHVKSNRMLHQCEEGFLGIGFVTESESAGMQYTTVLGIEFVHTEYTLQQFITAMSQCKSQCKPARVIWNNDMTVHDFMLPVDPLQQMDVLSRIHVDFTIFDESENLYIAASFLATPITRILFTRLKFTCITLDYLRRVLGIKMILPNLSILDNVAPCINSSHAPKVMQSEYHIKQAINPCTPGAQKKEVGKMFQSAESTVRPIGSSIGNLPTIETRAKYKVDLFNDEDGVILSQEYASRLRSVNYRIVTLMVDGINSINAVFPAKFPLEPNDLIVQIDATKVSVSSAYLRCEQHRKNLWSIYFKREYADKSIFVDSVTHHGRVVVISLYTYHYTTIGDKLTTLHGQKCTVAEIVDSDDADMIVSATCLKRLPLGEFIYGAIAANVAAGTMPMSCARSCFGYDWLFMAPETKERLFDTLHRIGHGNQIFLYTMRLIQESDSVLSYSNVTSIIRDSWVGQNMKGLINTGASCLTLPGMQSIERQGNTRLDYMLRRSAEDPKGYTLIDGISIDKSALTSLIVLSQFNTFNIEFC